MVIAQEPTQAHAAPATRALGLQMMIGEPSTPTPRPAIVVTTMVSQMLEGMVARAPVVLEHIQPQIYVQANKEPKAPTKNDTKVSQFSD
jgi:hypothetical protein